MVSPSSSALARCLRAAAWLTRRVTCRFVVGHGPWQHEVQPFGGGTVLVARRCVRCGCRTGAKSWGAY